MKHIHEPEFLRCRRGELIASWGEAELVRHLDGRYELRGGTPAKRRASGSPCSCIKPPSKYEI